MLKIERPTMTPPHKFPRYHVLPSETGQGFRMETDTPRKLNCIHLIAFCCLQLLEMINKLA